MTARMMEILEKVSLQIQPDDPGLSEWCKLYYKAHKERLSLDLVLCEQYFRKDEDILEIGSIPPYLTGALKILHFPVTGVDIAPERFSQCIQTLGLKLHKCDIERERLPFADHAFRWVLMNEILEHLRIDIIFTIDEVYRVMKPGGLLMLSTPNLHSLKGILNFLFKQRAFAVAGVPYVEFRKLRELGHMGHMREYTPVEVRELMSQCGFIPRRTIFRGKGFNRVDSLTTWILPRLKPFFTMILQKA